MNHHHPESIRWKTEKKKYLEKKGGVREEEDICCAFILQVFVEYASKPCMICVTHMLCVSCVYHLCETADVSVRSFLFDPCNHVY